MTSHLGSRFVNPVTSHRSLHGWILVVNPVTSHRNLHGWILVASLDHRSLVEHPRSVAGDVPESSTGKEDKGTCIHWDMGIWPWLPILKPVSLAFFTQRRHEGGVLGALRKHCMYYNMHVELRGQRVGVSWRSPSITWVPGFNLRSSGLGASSL